MNREFKKRPRQRQREHHLKIISRLFKVIMRATYILIMLECEIASGDSEIKKKEINTVVKLWPLPTRFKTRTSHFKSLIVRERRRNRQEIIKRRNYKVRKTACFRR